MQKELADLEIVDVTIKLAALPFEVVVSMSIAEYLYMLYTLEYKGQAVSAVLMQSVGQNEIWSDNTGRVIVNPLWEQPKETDDDYSDPISGN